MDKQKFQLWCTLQKKQMQQNNDGQMSQLKVLFTQATSEVSGETAHLRSLARAFAVRTF